MADQPLTKQLLEQAGSTKVTHLHGELKKARPIDSYTEIFFWEKDLNLGDLDENGVQLRPHIVWFGEMVPEMDMAISIARQAELLLVIGTSMQVYPAAGLIDYIPSHCKVYAIDPNLKNSFADDANFLKMSATQGMKKLKEILIMNR